MTLSSSATEENAERLIGSGTTATVSARAGNRRFRPLSALRAHTKAPYKTDLHRKTLMALNRPGTARTDGDHPAPEEVHPGLEDRRDAVGGRPPPGELHGGQAAVGQDERRDGRREVQSGARQGARHRLPRAPPRQRPGPPGWQTVAVRDAARTSSLANSV